MTTPVIEVAIVEAGFETYSLNIDGNIIPKRKSKDTGKSEGDNDYGTPGSVLRSTGKYESCN